MLYIKRKRKVLRAPSQNAPGSKKIQPSYSIRQATAADIEVIRNLALEIWPRTYGDLFSPQQVVYMLNTWFSEVSLLRQLRDGYQLSIIYAGNHPIGFTSLSEIRPYIFKLHKIYLLPAYQGLGAGKFVMEHIIATIKAQKASSLLLNVNQHSPAKAFYEHLGFKVARTERTEVGKGYYANEYVMELPLDGPVTKSEKQTSFLSR